MVQQGVAAGEQETVRLRLGQLQGQFARLDLVHPKAPGLDHAFFAQPAQHPECALAGHVEVFQPFVAIEVLGDIVNPDDIQAVGAQALEAVLDGTQRGIGGVVVDDLVRPAMGEHPGLLAQVTGGDVFDFVEDHPADLAAQHILVPRMPGQGLAEADLRQPGTVERRGVEVTHTLLPGGLDGGERFVLGNGPEHVAQRGGAKTQGTLQFVSDTHEWTPSSSIKGITPCPQQVPACSRGAASIAVSGQILGCELLTVQDIICAT